MAAFSVGDVAFDMKPDGTPVSAIDVSVENRLRAVLEERRPGDGFLGEETGSAGSEQRRWIIDPIDGTAYFVRGRRFWGTQIALEVDGEVVLGVTTSPAVRTRWWGVPGAGAFRKAADETYPTALQVSQAEQIRGAR